MRRTAIALVTSDRFTRLLSTVRRSRVAIVMLHRFEDRELGVAGHSVDGLRANLDYIRRNRIPVLGMRDLLKPSRDDVQRGGVIFTIDDGYTDFERVAAPVFAEFDCPVTVFVAPGVIDGETWFWWDRVEHALRRAQKRTAMLELDHGRVTVEWSDASPGTRVRATEQLVRELKRVPDVRMREALHELETQLDAPAPDAPPPEYQVMSWGAIGRLANRGVSFAPHSVSHPMLPLLSRERAAAEIEESWTRLRARCRSAAPIFCYPSGSFSPREIELVRRAGLEAAVTTDQRYASADDLNAGDDRRFAIPRFAYPEQRESFVQIANGFEGVKQAVRNRRQGR